MDILIVDVNISLTDVRNVAFEKRIDYIFWYIVIEMTGLKFFDVCLILDSHLYGGNQNSY